MLAEEFAERLQGVNWVGIPFGGGMCEIPYINARTIVASDIHQHILNLARVVANPEHCAALQDRLHSELFHSTVLMEAQSYCIDIGHDCNIFGDISTAIEWAAKYYITCWMTRASKAGTKSEFGGGVSIRWEGAGGDSVKRFRSAIESLPAWTEYFRDVTFLTMDCFEFLEKCRDQDDNAIYCDPPFLGPGNQYKHPFTKEDHVRLAAALAAFRSTRVVCRFYDIPEMRELYQAPKWEWKWVTGRKQTNEDAPEVIVQNRV